MIRLRAALTCLGATSLMLAMTACHQTATPDPARPDAYALQWPLEPATGAALQRFALPPAALAAVQRGDLGDVRVFDGRSRPVPLALIDTAANATQHVTALPLYPVSAPADGTGAAGVKVRIEGDSASRVVTVDSTGKAGGGAGSTMMLLDTHALREPVSALDLNADIPADRPVPLTLQSSADFKDWEPLADKVLFRPASGAALLGGGRVALPGIDLHDRYISVSWPRDAGLVMKGATATTSSTAPSPRVSIAATLPALTDAHELRFDLPNPARISGFRLTETPSDGVIPIRLYGRDHAEDPWTPVAAATLRPAPEGLVLDLGDHAYASYRLEADSRTAGFSAPPRIDLLFAPVTLAISLSGTAPYRLAVGQAAAQPSYLTPAEIAPGNQETDWAGLPVAKIAVPQGSPPPVILGTDAADRMLDRRKLVLWLALLLGTCMLGFIAFRLMRESAARP